MLRPSMLGPFVSTATCMLVMMVLGACGEGPRATAPTAESNTMSATSAQTSARPSAGAEIKGVATYRERMALPPDARFEATLEDVSRADAPSQVIGRTESAPAGQPPFRFSISYDPAQIQQGRSYAVRARVSHAGRLLFTTDRHYALPAAGQELEIMLVRAQSPADETASTATLENTYWKLMTLGDMTVNVASEQREPYLVLHADEQRVAGYGGCNRLLGSYSLSGDSLTFSQMAGTMMACDEGMEYEQAFHDALGKVASWRIDGERLELLDGNGTAVAQFESRYMP